MRLRVYKDAGLWWGKIGATVVVFHGSQAEALESLLLIAREVYVKGVTP